MARPTDKKTLLDLSEKNFNKLLDFINSLPEEYQNKQYDNNILNDRDKTVSDVICHLHEWHLMMMNWYKIGMSGKKPVLPAEDVTWQKLPILNQRIWEKYRGVELQEGIKMVKKSHKDIMLIIDRHNDEELFTKKRYNWTGSTSLGSYLISSSSSHYDWAFKTVKSIKKIIK